MSKVNSSHYRGLMITGIVVTLFVIWGCTNETKPSAKEREIELSAWITDWQWKSGIEDYRSITNGLTSVQVFAAYFNSTDRLFYTEENIEAIPNIMKIAKEGSLVKVDLTIVNDQFKEDGKAVQKDSDLLTRLMATKESRKAHIDDIVKLAKEYDFRGVEIDYEKVKDADWENICAFYEELYIKLKASGKSLRIVLEPRTPIEKINLPKGPTYVMMVYNLYGYHSGPGPKADHPFIEKMAQKMKQLPGENYLAFATGGFDWPQEGKITALTESEAANLKKISITPAKRDEASGSVYFEYLDKESKKHTVWYADDVTLAQWIESSKKAGYYKIALWRTGGFEQATLDYLNK